MKRLGMAAILGLTALSATAADENAVWNAGIAASFAEYEWDNDVIDDSSTGFKLFTGYRFNKWFGIEGAYHKFGDFEDDTQPGVIGGDADLELKGPSLSALLYIPLPADDVELFAKAGYYRFKQDLLIDDAPAASNRMRGATLGAGLGLELAENLRARVEGDWFAVDDADLWALNVGIEYLFGRAEAAPEPAPAPPPPPAAPPPPADSDGDGVPDNRDACPGTPAGATVDERGCELDSDGDGVVDRLDECPGTPKGATVDAKGCARQLILRDVTFGFDSAELTDSARQYLNTIAGPLSQRERLTIEVQGHTDSRGADAYNLDLSRRRAESVRTYLIEQGVPASSLEAEGYGETQPMASNETEEGRAQNRRVTLEFTEQAGE